MGFASILEKYRKISFSERDKGDRFERLICAYLQTDPQYAARLKKVYLWEEFPGRKDLGGKDLGIDLVALTHEGDYWAIQCKCYDENTAIDKPAVDSFLSTSSREFMNEELQTTRFTHRLWISTTNKWGTNAEEAIKNQNPPVTRINLSHLQNAPVDWDKLDAGVFGEAARNAAKSLRPHQNEALNNAHAYFKEHERGKLIMACGTGKTFNSLRIAENETGGNGLVLFLVPSIALLGQTLREWTADAKYPVNPICICSDPEITRHKKKNEDESENLVDLAFPASTKIEHILNQFYLFARQKSKGMTVVFSTYQSIDVISKVQKDLLKNGFSEFDLIICDEAHRTTGVTFSGEQESAWTKVHDNNFIKSKKRLYMTATPRLYSDDSKSKAARNDAILCSMDDKEIYGEEIYRIGFGEAVEQGLLTDYKVLILTLNQNDVPPAVQNMITDDTKEINTDDASKLIGCINALSKQILGDEGSVKETDPDPMRRAVAFCPMIAASKTIAGVFNTAGTEYLNALPEEKKKEMVAVSSQHIDGTMNAPKRDELLSWLKEQPEDGQCRVLTNVRCLSEGVDVPSLDAVMFLTARNSQVDVVQSVGRVMRKSPNKKYGYIIIPVLVPAKEEAHLALDDNERYKVVWTVLNALRAHDDRFNAIVNKIELNKKRPDNIIVGRPSVAFDKNGEYVAEPTPEYGNSDSKIAQQLTIQFGELQSVIFARMVAKVGDRLYWEQWAKEVAQIAEREIERITNFVSRNADNKKTFDDFLGGLQKSINPGITQSEAIEMLAQHIITKPVFEALFEGYSFVQNNPISLSMQKMLDLLETQAIEKDTQTLNTFYESVKMRASGIDNAEGRQRIIIELYDKFFKTAFPKMVERLGIVYTPVEIVDFIIHSVNDVLQKEFNRTLSDENVNILDPFTGTGTFITRLLQSGLINKKDMQRKYESEIFANEIVLLAYYIAAVNIENAYHEQSGNGEYKPFAGICLTDTFQLGETEGGNLGFSELFKQNSERVEKQRNTPLTVIMGNPPYREGQESAMDNAKSQKYEKLEAKIAETYVENSEATLNTSVYDSYIKAFRWSTDRIDPQNGGIVAFITNSGWIDKGGFDGFRKCLEKDFSSAYVFDLKGAIRAKSGETAKREGQNVFDIMTGVAITVLVKNPLSENNKASIYYRSIGDYLKRNEKFDVLKKVHSITNFEGQLITPNEQGDWINKRNDEFSTLIPLAPEKKFDIKAESFFVPYSLGIATNKDNWLYNFSIKNLETNLTTMVDFYNNQRIKYHNDKLQKKQTDIIYDKTKISWTDLFLRDLESNIAYTLSTETFCDVIYRPFVKQKFCYEKSFLQRTYQQTKLYPTVKHKNLFICVSGLNTRQDRTSVFISEIITDLNLLDAGTQCFPLYYYEENKNQAKSLFDATTEYTRRDGVSDFILSQARTRYGKTVTKEDIFYYVYGFLHSPDYREKFANDLKKMLPRLPLVDTVKDFWTFSKAGRTLANLHLNYETVPPCPDVKVSGAETKFYTVEKMKFPAKGQKDTILYNSKITVSNIPAKAYEYVVNGKSAIEWIMERYQVKTDKDSGITNDPNDWATEHGKPSYILDLLLSVINVSVQTVDVVGGLPIIDYEVTPEGDN